MLLDNKYKSGPSCEDPKQEMHTRLKSCILEIPQNYVMDHASVKKHIDARLAALPEEGGERERSQLVAISFSL